MNMRQVKLKDNNAAQKDHIRTTRMKYHVIYHTIAITQVEKGTDAREK